MTGKNNISDLFNPGGCLNQSTIAKFIDNKLDEEELQKVISHLDTCPLCKDAVEGITGVGTEQFVEDLKKLRTGFYATLSDNDKKNRFRIIAMISAAASVIIVLGVLFFYQRIRQDTDDTIAQSDEKFEEAKEKEATGKGTGPLNEAAQPAITERREAQEQISESVDVIPAKKNEEELVQSGESAQDSFYTEMEIIADKEVAEPVSTEHVMELSDEQTVTPDMQSMAAASGKARTKSIVNADITQEGNMQEARSALPARQVLYVNDQKPTFQGGDIDRFRDYLQNQLNRSDLTINKTGTDSVLITFLVDTAGKPANIRLLNQIDPEAEKAIIRLVESSPDWSPAIENGIRINVGYTISVKIPFENAR